MNRAESDAELDHSEHKLILGSRIIDTPVFNPAGHRIGHVSDLSIERVSGKVIYAIISFGGFLGIGEKFHPVPWSLLDYNLHLSGYQTVLDRTALEAAPSYDRSELSELGGSRHLTYGERIFGYYDRYGSVPYW